MRVVVTVAVGVAAVDVAVGVALAVTVAVGVTVSVAVGVVVAVRVGVGAVDVAAGVAVNVTVGVAVGVTVAVAVSVGVPVVVSVGVALNVVNINLISLYQQLIPDALRGKVFGLLTALSLSLQPIAYGVMGALVDLLPSQGIFLASGLVIAANGLTLLRLPELRRA